MSGSRVDCRVEIVGYGRAALAALSSRVAAARQGHPLDPVTVVVPSHVAGLAARRALAVGGGGLANVAFLTPAGLAEAVAGPMPAGRPLTETALGAAVRGVLREVPGHLAGVAGHERTEAALASTSRELRAAHPRTLEAIAAASARGREVVRLHHAVRDRLAGHHDDADLVERALARLGADPDAAGPLGAVVWYLPARCAPGEAALVGRVLAAVAGAGREAATVVALTGHPEADTPVVDTCAAAGVPVAAADAGEAPAPPAPPVPSRLLTVPDADEEVRTAVREVVAMAGRGVPLDRIAVVHPVPEPYALALHQELAAAGIPHNGPGARRLADTVPGRTLLAALSLDEHQWTRRAVMDLVAGAPVRHRGEPVPAGRWEALSREAGVVGGRADWQTKLASAPGPPDALAALHAFVGDLAARIDGWAAARGWVARVAAARAVLAHLLGGDRERAGWPPEEREAAEGVDVALGRLATLDGLDPDPSVDTFLRALRTELEAPAGRTGRVGEGVQLTPLTAAPGLDVDAVVVVGAAEGTCPARRHGGGLLSADDRERAVAGELGGRAPDLADQHHAFLAVLATADPAHRVVTCPRGDLRAGRVVLASRWLLDAAGARLGATVHSSDLAALGPSVVTHVGSFAAALAAAPASASLHERDLAVLAEHVDAGGDPLHHPAVGPDLARGLRCRLARRSRQLTEWDGNVARAATGGVLGAGPHAPTRLETWATCPFRYFLAHVLRVGQRDEPERVTELAPVDRGRLVHEVLERFVREAIERPGGPPAPHQRWGATERMRLHEIADELAARYEREGRTGRPLTWGRTLAGLHTELDRFLDADDAHRADERARPAAVELSFGGRDDAEPVEVPLSGRPPLELRGKVDRVDVTDDGVHVVLDYKTGQVVRDSDLDADPVVGGTNLQLGVYAEAARVRLGAGEVETRYWGVSDRGGYRRPGYRWTPERRARFLEAVGTIAEGIEAGVHPLRPGAYEPFFGTHQNCRYCDFDRLCPRDRDDHATAKRDAPELALLARLERPERGGERS